MSKQRSAPADWRQTSISTLGGGLPDVVQTGPFGAQLHSEDYVKEGIPFILIKNLRNGWVDESDMPRISEDDAKRLSMYALQKGDVVFTRVGRVGSCFLAEARHSGWIISGQMLRIRLPESKINHRYLIHALNSYPAQKRIGNASVGTTRQSINTKILSSLELPVPSPPEQRRIATVLDTVDEAIAKTEAVIAKLKEVRAGLLHDLLTRGLDEHGQLRDPIAHPEQFKDSPLGRIPREWDIKPLAEMVASAVDGPFGSNLKTAHYIDDHGVRVVRLQNIESGWFDDSDKAFVSEEHALSLRRHEVVAGDLLVASMGDENHPLARACLYPAHLRAGVVKADCFRLRMHPTMAVNGFVMLLLNCPSTRGEVTVLGQGVTRDRVNLTTLLTLRMLRPPVEKQKQIVNAVEALDVQVRTEECLSAKLIYVKSGLMDDLLTGRVRVPEGIADGGGQT